MGFCIICPLRRRHRRRDGRLTEKVEGFVGWRNEKETPAFEVDRKGSSTPRASAKEDPCNVGIPLDPGLGERKTAKGILFFLDAPANPDGT